MSFCSLRTVNIDFESTIIKLNHLFYLDKTELKEQTWFFIFTENGERNCLNESVVTLGSQIYPYRCRMHSETKKKSLLKLNNLRH